MVNSETLKITEHLLVLHFTVKLVLPFLHFFELLVYKTKIKILSCALQ